MLKASDSETSLSYKHIPSHTTASHLTPHHILQVCGPILRVYTTALLEDISSMLKDVTHGLVQERFRGFPWLVESLKHEVDLLLENKKTEARRVLDRIINSEVNWIFVNEADLNAIEREVALNMAGKTGGGLGVHKAVPTFAEPHDPSAHWSAELSKVVGPEELQGGVMTPLTQLDPDRDMRIRQLALDAYVRLMLRRVFYAVPMSVRNVLLTEVCRWVDGCMHVLRWRGGGSVDGEGGYLFICCMSSCHVPSLRLIVSSTRSLLIFLPTHSSGGT